MSKGVCNLNIKVRFRTEFKESLKMVGNIDHLGSWAPSKGFDLTTSSDTYPYWINPRPLRIPAGVKIEFKFVVYKEGQLIRWETLPNGNNRTYTTSGEKVRIECTEGHLQFSEFVLRSFESSEILEDVSDFKKVRPEKNQFNPFLKAQDSLSSDTQEDNSAEKFSSEDANSQENASDEDNYEQPSDLDKSSPTDFARKFTILRREVLKDKKVGELQTLLTLESERQDSLSIAYHLLQKQREAPKHRNPSIINTESFEDTIPQLDDDPVDVERCPSIIYASFALPVRVEKKDPSETIIEKKYSFVLEVDSFRGQILWWREHGTKNFVWLGYLLGEYDETDKEELAIYLKTKYNFVVLFMESSVKKVDDEYLKPFLYHAFYNFLDAERAIHQDKYVSTYEAINKEFAEQILNLNTNQKQNVIIQDYHLLMVPMYLAEKSRFCALSFIFQSSFPVVEIFKTFSNKKALLDSLFCCDHISFISMENLKSFYNISCKYQTCQLSCERGFLNLKMNGRKVYLKVIPPNIDIAALSTKLNSKDVIELHAEYSAEMLDVDIIITTARLNRYEGIEILIEAIKQLMRENKTSAYAFKIIKDSNHIERELEDKDYQEKIKKLIEKANFELKENACASNIELVENLQLNNKLVLFKSAYAYIAYSSYTDHNNDFLACYLARHKNGPGSILINEYIDTYKQFNSFIKFDPMSKKDLIEKLKFLPAKRESQLLLIESDIKNISLQRLSDKLEALATEFTKIRQVKSKQNLMVVQDPKSFKIISANRTFNKAEPQEIVKAFWASSNRLIICGFEGVLATINYRKSRLNLEEGTFMTSLALESKNIPIVERVALIPQTQVYVLSSSKTELLRKEFGDLSSSYLVAENGFYYQNPKQERFLSLFTADWNWKGIIMRIMQNYANRTEGISIEIKDSSLVWNYQNVRNDIASIQEKELVSHIQTVLAHVENVEIVKGHGSIEVKPSGVNKGLVLDLALEKIKQMKGSYPDFVMCVGNTHRDEEMIQKLAKINKDKADFKSNAIFNICVGRKPSSANYYVENVDEVYKIFDAIAEAGK